MVWTKIDLVALGIWLETLGVRQFDLKTLYIDRFVEDIEGKETNEFLRECYKHAIDICDILDQTVRVDTITEWPKQPHPRGFNKNDC